MPQMIEWSIQTYHSSVSSRCWAYTPYDRGWDGCPELSKDDALRRLVEAEHALATVPSWAEDTVERSINYLPGCPHWAFPSPYLEVLEAIESVWFAYCDLAVEDKAVGSVADDMMRGLAAKLQQLLITYNIEAMPENTDTEFRLILNNVIILTYDKTRSN